MKGVLKIDRNELLNLKKKRVRGEDKMLRRYK